MRGVGLAALTLLFVCGCSLWPFGGGKKRPEPRPETQTKPHVDANSVFVSVRLEGDEARFAPAKPARLFLGEMGRSGIAATEDAATPTDLRLEVALQVRLTRRTERFGPDEYEYRIEGYWKLLRTKPPGGAVYSKDVSESAAGGDRGTVLNEIITRIARAVAREVVEIVRRR